jgi:phytoene dehydrogenase-like protein
MLAFLAVNSTYRGPYTPGSATCLAFALAVPDESTAMMTKLVGGIGALTAYHMQSMFGAPAGDFCHGLLHPDLMGPNRPGPKGFRDLQIPIHGLYLAGAGCHGGPGITFTPGYNAGYQVLEDLADPRNS